MTISKSEKHKKVEKVKKAKSVENDDPDISSETEKITTISESPKVLVEENESENIVNCGIISNLPKDLPKDELVNFLSKRGVPITNINVNHNKYAIIEVNGDETADNIQQILNKNEMFDDSNVIQIHGKSQRIISFLTENKQLSSVIIIKNIAKNIKSENILDLIPTYKPSIITHSIIDVKSESGKPRRQMTLEVLSTDTDEIINQLNENQCKLECKKKFTVELQSANEETTEPAAKTKTNNELATNVIKIINLPLTANLEHMNELNIGYNKCFVSVKGPRKIGMMIFDTNDQAKNAFTELEGKEFMGIKLQLKRCYKRTGGDTESETINPCILHLTNLPFTCKQADIEAEFESVENTHFPLNDTGKSKGCCYLTFKTAEEAQLAKDLCDNKVIGGRPIRCKYAPLRIIDPTNETFSPDVGNKKRRRSKISAAQKKPNCVLTLFNLPLAVTESQIKSHFSGVSLINLVKKDEQFKGIAEIHFPTPEQATDAFKRTDIMIGGRKISKALKGGRWRNSHKKPKRS